MLYLSAIVLSFFLSFLLITKKNKSQGDYILAAWLGIIGFHLFSFYIVFTNSNLDYPVIAALGLSLPLSHGPFLYLYTTKQTSSSPFNKKQLFHFLPLLLSYLLFIKFYFLPLDQKMEVFKQKGQGFETQLLINLWAIYVSGIVYIILSLSRLLKYRKNIVHQFSNTEKINFNWLLYLILWMVLIWIVVLFVHGDKFIFTSVAFFVLWLGYFGIKQVRVFSQNTPEFEVESPETINRNPDETTITNTENHTENSSLPSPENSEGSKYQKSVLRQEEAALIHERLKHLMIEKKPFKDPDLTLNELAKSLEVHPNHLSQVINSREGKNFYELINERRVEEFRNLVAQSSNQQFTLLALSFDCGFNSKASFNRNFKKYTGLTPRDYLKNQVVMQ